MTAGVQLKLDRVGKTHWVGPYEKRTLQDVSLTLAAGDVVGIWGGQRSGKSTLLRIAAGLETPDRGAVSVAGIDLATLTSTQRGRLRLNAIGLVRNEGAEANGLAALEWVALPLLDRSSRSQARMRAMNMLRKVGIAECFDATWTQLSDSERVLLSLAHALVREPRLLLADDPTARLDALQQKEVVGLLKAAASDHGVAVLMTSSVLSALPSSHEGFLLSEGRLKRVADSSPAAEVVPFPRGKQMA